MLKKTLLNLMKVKQKGQYINDLKIIVVNTLNCHLQCPISMQILFQDDLLNIN